MPGLRLRAEHEVAPRAKHAQEHADEDAERQAVTETHCVRRVTGGGRNNRALLCLPPSLLIASVITASLGWCLKYCEATAAEESKSLEA